MSNATCDTGEASASINARTDDKTMPKVIAALREGALLYQPKSGFNYYVRRGGDIDGMVSLSPSRVKKLERQGFLRLVGEKTYGAGHEAACWGIKI